MKILNFWGSFNFYCIQLGAKEQMLVQYMNN